ncbi:BON domain-containing protein [Maridesulfovibrio sp.]|uniref:BON domain-containing protein n=1 Tax=unclassified Maridesulfovibrio TaxID=2794999 RepID=UPI003AFFAB10
MITRTKFLLIALILAILCFITYEANAGFVPYGKIFKAVKDERPYITQAQDSRLQLQLHKALILNCPSSLTNVASYVYSGHGFLVGEVESDAERDALLNCAKEINGLYGISYFLPQKTPIEEASSELEIKLKGIFDPEYPSSQITIKVVQNNVVILGVLNLQEQKSVCASVQKISKTSRIINFLQVPQQQKKLKKRFRPLRNLFSN